MMAMHRRGGYLGGLGRINGVDPGEVRASPGVTSAAGSVQGSTTASSRAASNASKRKTLGGRGREWAHFAHKLLESMFELDDSRPFRNQVDPLKYPNYYIKVTHPMDLSQVMMKLHRGSYDSLNDFGADIRLIFDNWKLYITDQSSPLYSTIFRVSLWFDQEFNQIRNEWDLNRCKRQRLNRELEQIDNTHSQKDPLPATMSTALPLFRPAVASPAGGAQTFVTSSSSIHSSITPQPVKVSSATAVTSSASMQGKYSNLPQVQSASNKKSKSQRVSGTSKKTKSRKNTKLVVSIKNGTCTVVQKKAKDTPGSPLRGPRHSQTVSTPAPQQAVAPSSTSSSVTPSSIPHSSASSSIPSASSRRPEARAADDNSGKEVAAVDPFKLEMEMEVTNIWFGPCRTKPLQKVYLCEEGFRMLLKGVKSDISFSIKTAEIVRAVGHLSRSRKHTIFLFVTPACEKRLRDLSTTHQVFGPKPKGDPCSLIAIFIKSLHPSQISKMVHIFWNMSKDSLFGQLFSEVDQKGALTILSNIKPQIMEKIAEKVREPGAVSSVASNDNISPGPVTQSSLTGQSGHAAPPNTTRTPATTSSSMTRANLLDMPVLADNNTSVTLNPNSSSSTSGFYVGQRGQHTEHHPRSRTHSKDSTSSSSPHGGHRSRTHSHSKDTASSNLTQSNHSRTHSHSKETTSSSSTYHNSNTHSNPKDSSGSSLPQSENSSHTQRQSDESTSLNLPQVLTQNESRIEPLTHSETRSEPVTHTESRSEPPSHCTVPSSINAVQTDSSVENSSANSPPALPSQELISSGESTDKGVENSMTVNSAQRPSLPLVAVKDYIHLSTPGDPASSARGGNVTPESPDDWGDDAEDDDNDKDSKPPTNEIESDLEIIIPSDSEDEMITNTLEDGDDEMVMTRQTINTKCPIIQCVMKCPMKNRICGHNYDRDGVQQLIINRSDKARCPVPGCSNITPLNMKDMTFDYDLLRVIKNKQEAGASSS